MSDLAQFLTENLRAAGWVVQQQDDLLTAEKRVILARWLLGSRRVDHRLRVRLDASAHILTLQEVARESVAGMPPPSFSVTKTGQKGLEVREERSDHGFGGGGLHYGDAREWIKLACEQRGWEFRLSIGQP